MPSRARRSLKVNGFPICACAKITTLCIHMYTVLVIAGTTAVGKTDLSLELAKLVDIEVVSVDSAQVAILLA